MTEVLSTARAPARSHAVKDMVWDDRATEVDLSISLAEERAWLRCLDGYVRSGGSEWAGGETDSDDDVCDYL